MIKGNKQHIDTTKAEFEDVLGDLCRDGGGKYVRTIGGLAQLYAVPFIPDKLLRLIPAKVNTEIVKFHGDLFDAVLFRKEADQHMLISKHCLQ